MQSFITIIQLQNEMWIFRGTLARDARCHVARLYGLEASERYLLKARNAEERDLMKVRFTKVKVAKLLDDRKLFLKAIPRDVDVSVPAASYKKLIDFGGKI